jgi:hypothetical protein
MCLLTAILVLCYKQHTPLLVFTTAGAAAAKVFSDKNFANAFFPTGNPFLLQQEVLATISVQVRGAVKNLIPNIVFTLHLNP